MVVSGEPGPVNSLVGAWGGSGSMPLWVRGDNFPGQIISAQDSGLDDKAD
jgi:hypothetical protein